MKKDPHAEWFKDQMSQTGLSLRRLAKVIGMDPAALSRCIHGERKFQLEEAFDFSIATGCKVEQIYSHLGGDLESAKKRIASRMRDASKTEMALPRARTHGSALLRRSQYN